MVYVGDTTLEVFKNTPKEVYLRCAQRADIALVEDDPTLRQPVHVGGVHLWVIVAHIIRTCPCTGTKLSYYIFIISSCV